MTAPAALTGLCVMLSLRLLLLTRADAALLLTPGCHHLCQHHQPDVQKELELISCSFSVGKPQLHVGLLQMYEFCEPPS